MAISLAICWRLILYLLVQALENINIFVNKEALLLYCFR
jgi:hypothetical protein